MKLTDALLGEHGVFYAMFDSLEQAAAVARTPKEISAATEVVGVALLSHSAIEDELLFPALERVAGKLPPVEVMRHQHQEIERLAVAIGTAPDVEAARRAVRALLDVTREHFMKEEAVLFPMAAQAIDDATFEQLGVRWASMRSVRI